MLGKVERRNWFSDAGEGAKNEDVVHNSTSTIWVFLVGFRLKLLVHVSIFIKTVL